MATIAHWNTWYQIEVRGWLFLEPGEAKTIIDSHHAAVSNWIVIFNKYYSPKMLPKILISL